MNDLLLFVATGSRSTAGIGPGHPAGIRCPHAPPRGTGNLQTTGDRFCRKAARTMIAAVACLFVLISAQVKADKRPVDWVKPEIDTHKCRWFFFSSACRPFGMVNLSPDTETKGDWGAGYIYGKDTIQCFSHLHGWQLAGLPVMPATAPAKFSHDDEIIRPGYHKVVLRPQGITAELTSTTRVGFHRYSFPEGVKRQVLVDLGMPLMDFTILGHEARVASPDTIEGSFVMGPTMRRPKPLTVYFVATFDQPFRPVGDWGNGRVLVEFPKKGSPLLLKVAISYTGLEGARRNLADELPGWDFDGVVRDSADEWNRVLGRIEVEGGTDAQKTKFYTDLWHALLGRRIVSDLDGRYIDNTGKTPVVRQGRLPHHNFDAWWGSHWSLNILWPMAWPEVMNEFCETMIGMYRNGGLIPRGPSGGNYTYVMIGDPATPFFASAYAAGIRGWDVEKAYQGMRKNAFAGGIRDHAGYEQQSPATGGGMKYYEERGYVPEDIPDTNRVAEKKAAHRDGAAMTLEYSYQDWCLGQMAKALGKHGDAEFFLRRSQNYRNLWDPGSGWMHPRTLEGGWIPGFTPIGQGFATKGFCEANSAIYTFFVPHDVPGLIGLFGGPDNFNRRLNESFEKAEPRRFVVPHGKHAEGWIDYENEPSTGMAHLFNHSGAPWLAQKWIRKIHDLTFSDVTPMGGYHGDEDQGQMGAVSALQAMGLFAEDGAASMNPRYEITAPLFDKVTIHVRPGKTFVITTTHNRPENIYIRSARLNGTPWTSCFFPQSVFLQGGSLDLDLGPQPNKSWGL